jgi:hypothetical protein
MTKPHRTLPVTTWSPEDITAMLDLTERGWNARRIAAYLNRSPTGVAAWLKRHGVHEERMRRRRAIAALAAAEPYLTNVAIAERLGCSTDLVGDVRGPRPASRVERFATSTRWLDQPPARVRVAREAEGIEP